MIRRFVLIVLQNRNPYYTEKAELYWFGFFNRNLVIIFSDLIMNVNKITYIYVH